MRYSWTCRCCGKQQDELPTSWDSEAPFDWKAFSDADIKHLQDIEAEFFSVGGDHFIHGLIEIPIVGTTEAFSWGAWTSLSAQSVEIVRTVWKDSDRHTSGPFFGWLCTPLPYEPKTLHLKTMVHLRAPPTIPFIELEPTDHPLAVEQRNGISMERVIAIAETLMPRH